MQLQPDTFAKMLIDSIDQPLLLLDVSGVVIGANRAAEDKLGDGARQLLGVHLWQAPGWPGAPALVERQQDACRRALQGETSKFVTAASASHATGYEYTISPVQDPAGTIVYLMVKILPLPAAAPQASAPAELRPLASAPQLPAAAGLAAINQDEVSFRLMVESIEDYAMFIVGLDGFITSWNRGAERLTGYSEHEAVGRHFSILYPRDQFDQQHAELELAIAKRDGRYEEEGVRVRKDGSRYQAQINVWRVDDTVGNTVCFAKITRDVTALRQAQRREAQLLESENRFRLMVEGIQDYAMFMVDLNGLITSWNRGAERLTGYSERDALGRHFSMLYPREDLDESHAAYELAMARQHDRHEEEGLRVRKDGSVYNAQITIWPVRDKGGQVIGFAKITRDVTSHRQAERALHDSEAKFRTIADAMPHMVWSMQAGGQFDYANQQWFRFSGRTETEPAAISWFDLVHPGDRARTLSVWQQSLATGQSYEIQYRLRHISGNYRWVLGRALAVRDESDKIVRWMGTHTDIHEQKQAEQTLQEAGRRKDEFLAMLAHELRNPLAPVRNSTLLIHKLGSKDERVLRSLDVIDRQVQHMTRLIDDLLDVARISRGKIVLRKEHVSLDAIVRQVVADFKPEYEAKGVRLVMQLPARPLELLADPTRIAQSVGNLLHNALKFTEAGGEVAVFVAEQQAGPNSGEQQQVDQALEVHQAQQANQAQQLDHAQQLDQAQQLNLTPQVGQTPMALIKVSDTGIGIEPELADQLFTPFVQAAQDLARSQGGLGLGLALIKGFVELHGGRVVAASQGLGKGSAFTIQLPMEPAPVKLPAPRDAASPAITGLTIALIDDNHDMVETLEMLLVMEGHRVVTAYDGESGIALVATERPDLVLCDIGLPGGKDGYAVARAIRASHDIAATYLVALSGYGQEQDRQQAIANGFNKHLLKPLDFEKLRSILNRARSNKIHAASA